MKRRILPTDQRRVFLRWLRQCCTAAFLMVISVWTGIEGDAFGAEPVKPDGATLTKPCRQPEPILYASAARILKQARRLRSQGKDTEALERLTAFADRNPSQTHNRLYFLMGQIAAKQKDYAQAERWFDAAVKRWPCFEVAVKSLAAVRHRKVNPTPAAQHTQPVKPDAAPMTGNCHQPEPILYVSAARILTQARRLTSEGKKKEALKLLTDFEQQNPLQRHDKLYFLMGMIAAEEKDYAQAGRWFEEAVKLWPCFGEAVKNLSVARYREGKPKMAAELMERACELLYPPDPQMLYDVSVFWIKAGDKTRAIPFLEKACRKSKQTQWWLLLLKLYMEKKEMEKASPILAMLLKREPDRVDLWKMQAWIALKQKDVVKAAACLHIAYIIQPPQPAEREQLAQIYLAAGIPMMAVKQYRLAFGRDPRAEQLDLIAQVYLKAHHEDAALKWALTAIKKKPTAKRWAFAGNLYLSRDDYQEAFRAFSKASRIGDRDGSMSLAAGYAAAKMKFWNDAVHFLQKAADNASANAQVKADAVSTLRSIEAFLQQEGSARTEGRHQG